MSTTTPAELSSPVLPGPTPRRDRFISLDVIRGLSVLGILLINIQWFGMVENAYVHPYMTGGLTRPNYIAWLFAHVTADLSLITVFSMLFGVGILLMTSRREARGVSPRSLHLRRMFVLLLLGLMHGYLLWYGDILYSYALCGTLAYFCRHWRPRRLLIVGVLLIAAASVFMVAGGLLLTLARPEITEDAIESIRKDWFLSPEAIASEEAIYRGSWRHQMEHRAKTTLLLQTTGFLGLHVWRVTGSILLGMAMFKLNLLSGETARRWAGRFMIFGFGIGLPVVLYGVYTQERVGWEPVYSYFFGTQYLYWGSLPVALGWIGVALGLSERGWLPALTRRLAAVGQLSLTNYLMQTVIGTTIFYGHGLGLFGRVSHVGQMAMVLAIWALQLWYSSMWLRYFEFGPVEWLWRSASYRRLLPNRRAASTVATSNEP